MLGAIRKFVERRRAPYARKVATALIREGFDPRELERIDALDTLTPGSDLFDRLAQRRLKPSIAATAIRLATNRFRTLRPLAEKEGWPVKRSSDRPAGEACFLELVDEAADSLRFAR